MSSNSMQERIIELMSERIAKLCAKVEQLTRERDEARSEVERQRAEIERQLEANKQLVAGIDTITRRKQEEIERLREMLLDIAAELRGEEPRIVFSIRKALEAKP